MTNLFDILINAPKGLELYTPVFGKVYFQGIEDNLIEGNSYPIIVIDENNKRHSFTENGEYLAELDTECVLFPSKEHKWDNWQEVLFKQGDYIICEVVNISENQQNVCCIYNEYNKHYNDYAGYFYCHEGITSKNLNKQILLKNARYATPEEREQFMAELNANGYKWNADTKQIEKIEQKNTQKYDCSGYEGTIIIEKPFTIDDFKPFDKVLVQDLRSHWTCDFYIRYDDTHKLYACITSTWDKCIPYNNETKHLLGTDDDCPDKYKTW